MTTLQAINAYKKQQPTQVPSQGILNMGMTETQCLASITLAYWEWSNCHTDAIKEYWNSVVQGRLQPLR